MAFKQNGNDDDGDQDKYFFRLYWITSQNYKIYVQICYKTKARS